MLADFAPISYQPLHYPSILVGSSNDPYCPARLASAYARAWGSEFVRLQNLGHINTESGHGDWPLGKALQCRLCRTTSKQNRRQGELTRGENLTCSAVPTNARFGRACHNATPRSVKPLAWVCCLILSLPACWLTRLKPWVT